MFEEIENELKNKSKYIWFARFAMFLYLIVVVISLILKSFFGNIVYFYIFSILFFCMLIILYLILTKKLNIKEKNFNENEYLIVKNYIKTKKLYSLEKINILKKYYETKYIKTNEDNLIDVIALIISVSSFFCDPETIVAKFFILLFILLTYWFCDIFRKTIILLIGNEDIYSKLYKIFSVLSIEILSKDLENSKKSIKTKKKTNKSVKS